MPKFLSEIQFVTTGSMDTPSPGFIILYANTDGNLYAETSDGNQIQLSINPA